MIEPTPWKQAEALFAAGQFREAAALLEEANRRRPNSSEILNNLGAVYEQLGKTNAAIDCFRRAATLAPDQAVPVFNAGDLLRRAGRLDEAIDALRVAATLDPNLPDAWSSLGAALVDSGRPLAALGALHRAIDLRPEITINWLRRADAQLMLRRFADAQQSYTKAIERDPSLADAWYGLGRAYLENQRPELAIPRFERCLVLDPQSARCMHDLGKAMFQIGCVETAMRWLRRAAESGPDDVRRQALESMAVIVPGCPDDDNRAIAATRTAFASTLASRPPRRRDRRTNPSPIRVGYVSSFFHRPNWMKPVWALLNHHDRGRVCVHLFSDCPPTQIQGGYRPHDRDLCHDISNCSNQEACRLIEKQQLDLLVDLNSYSALKRIGLYALRPAPIIVGWFNLYATSGLAAFDYLIGDETVIPPTEEVFYSERILRVPHTYLAFDVDYPVPDIAPVPMKATGTLTIGSLASLYKLTDQVLATWSEIMARCPNATLLIRNAGLKHPEQRALLSTRFATAGVETNRLILEGPADHHEYLRTYDRIDFALDPFPYGGGTTTMEALWQGVPVVTLNGDRWASRTSASLLHAAGLDEYVARDRGDYVELAARLATSVETADRLGVFRATIRDRLRQSPACDGAAMARAMEALYSEIVKRKG